MEKRGETEEGKEEEDVEKGGETEKGKEDEAITLWDCGSPLYDSYELVSHSHLIDRHLMVLPCLSRSKTQIQFSRPASSLIQSTSKIGVTRKEKETSVFGFLRDFVQRNVWKKKMNGGRKEKGKKQKTGLYELYNRIGSGRK